MNKIYLPVSKMNDLETIIKESWELKVRLNQLSLDERKIIVLSGDHGVGKDVWANLMKTKNPEIEIIRFADPLREAFNQAGTPNHAIDSLKRTNFKFSGFEVDGYQLDGMTMREALVHVAESNKVKFGQDYYAKQAIEKAQLALERNPHSKLIVFTDMRFLAENEALQDFAAANALYVERINIPEGLPKIEVLQG
nr:MAG TPA: deoxynucleoside monophosphate kinase [Caudoviricetes sp.]